jgi:carbon-monoxide dehydrogenase small subunit
MRLSFIVNGRKRACHIQGDETLLEVLRDELGLTGAKNGCERGNCGACAIIVNGELVNSCLMLAIQARGCRLTTIEGVGSSEKLDRIQSAFVEQGAIQCGYCTPAMILAAKNFLDTHKEPTEAEIRKQMCGILCRCTGYNSIIKAIQVASKRRPKK